jgi:quinol monooxygenase YgiN
MIEGDIAHVSVVAVFTPRPGARDALIAALRETIPAVHDEPGCLLYAIHDAEDGTIVMVEKWATAAHLARHADGPASTRMAARVAPHLDEPVRIVPMTALPAGDQRLGLL